MQIVSLRQSVIGAIVVGLAAIGGCTAAPTNLAAGERCIRSAQCQAGLVCNAGMCTADLTGFGMGMVPSADAGMNVVDAGEPEDAGDVDATIPPDEDAGSTPVDSGTTPVDSGPPPVDSGPPPVDSGPPEMDAGPPETDAGTPDDDAGT